MLRGSFGLGCLLSLLITSTVSTQHVFQQEQAGPVAKATVQPRITLDKTWQVLGPFPAGMRELPFGGFPPSVSSSYEQLLDPGSGQPTHFSTYGPLNATTTLKTFDATVHKQDTDHVQQSLNVEYPDVDWPWVRKSAGWSSLQWQMIASTNLQIGQNSTAVAITMDKTAEFAIVPATASEATQNKAIEWHTGDWYSYIAAFSKEDNIASELPISHHVLHLDQGSYKLLVRSMYEIRIFGDPRNNANAESPKIVLGVDIAVRGVQDSEAQDLLEIHTDLHHSNVPHVVGGWIAGWGLSFGLRNLSPNVSYTVQSLETASPSSAIKAELGLPLKIVPGQTLVVPVNLNQTQPLDVNVTGLDLTLCLESTSGPSFATTTKAVHIPLIQKPAFWDASSNDEDHDAYMFSYLADDQTVQLAAATPPKRASRAAAPKGLLPPLILTLHGAGVDLRDLFFSNSIRKQNDSWVILPTGRTPWGYDWQLASFKAADTAVKAFHKHLYGLPPTLSEDERQMWQFDPEKRFIMGHSNGGQGAWYRLAHFPDHVIGGVVAAAYTKVSDYVSFAWKVGRHFTDPALQGLLHSSLTMFENDLFASNLAGLDLLVKYGSADANVPPWNSKDMAMTVDGWNRRSGLESKVKVSEVPGRPHWWNELFSEADVQSAIEAACLLTNNPGYKMPDTPQNFTLTVANPAEAGSKGGWRISELDVPGRLAKLEVRYVSATMHDDAESNVPHYRVSARNAKRLELDLATLRRSSYTAFSFANATSIKISLNGQSVEADFGESGILHLTSDKKGRWQAMTDEQSASASTPARPIGPLLRIVSTQGPMVLIVPSGGPTKEVAAWNRVARRFAADLLLYGAINSQIMTDADFASNMQANLERSNIVAFGGPQINSFSRSTFDNWPTDSPIKFPSADCSNQFEIQGRSFYENGTALLTLAPHPTYSTGLAMVVHGIGAKGISRAARLLPTRTATMIPEWIVTDSTAEWMGEGGVQAAGWYDKKWGWSESMSYVQ